MFPRFKEYTRRKYIDNVDERLAFGEPILQYKEYLDLNGEFLTDLYEEEKEEWYFNQDDDSKGDPDA